MNTKLAVVAACIGLAMIAGAPAQAIAKKNYKNAINLAGAQRMLSQRMTKEVLLIAFDHEREANLKSLAKNHERFSKVLAGLRKGDEALDLQPEDSAEIVARLAKVDKLWPVYQEALEGVMKERKVSPERLSQVAELNLPVLVAMNEAVKAFEEQANNGKLVSFVNVAVNESGKLRMLSQKMTKEFLLVAYQHQPEQNRQSLQETMATFERIVDALINGSQDLHLLPAPTPEIETQLREVERRYFEIKAVLVNAVNGKELTKEHLNQLAELNLTLLAAAHAAVLQFEAL